MGKEALASILDNLYADRVENVEKFTIMTYSKASDQEAQEILNEWAQAGYIEIIKPLSECEKMEPCIRLVSFIQENPNCEK